MTTTESHKYSEVTDMLLGQMELASGLDAEKFVIDAADEIDIKLGFIYRTPIRGTGENDLPRPVSLLLKRLSVYISTARAIMATIGASQQGERTNAYARSLLAEAHGALDAIATDRMVLEGAERLPDAAEETRGPRIFNVDSYSQVDAFYGHFTGGSQDLFSPSPFAHLAGCDPHSG